MLESIRSHRRWLMFFLLALVFPSFVVTGIYGYSQMTAADAAVARLDGEPISPQELDNAQRQRMAGGRADRELLDSSELRFAVIDNLVQQRLLLERAIRTGLVVTD
ncbi:MAG: SurA N-terminal domain-containing protein, partial [Betaproteobacteria bacterium]